MISLSQINEECPKAYQQWLEFIFINPEIENISTSTLIYFLDTKHLFIGITSDSTGEDWIIELNSIIIGVKQDRINAEDFIVSEAFRILEIELNKEL